MLTNPELVLGFIGLNPTELIVIFLIILLLFGGSKLPELAKSMGKAMRTFKEESNQLKREIESEAHRDDKKIETKSSASMSSSTPGSSSSNK